MVPCPWAVPSLNASTYLPAARTGVSPPPQPLCVSPLSPLRRVRAAPRGAARRGARTYLHWAMSRCLARGVYYLATRPRSCQKHALASVLPRNPSASAPSACPSACARRRGGVRAPISTGVCVGAVPVEFAILERANVAASSTHRPQSPRNPSASDPSACPGACARHRGARPGGVRAPSSIGPCGGAVAAFFVLTPLALVPASRPHRRQSPPAAPLRQPPQPAPARARGAAGRGQAGCAHLPPSGHVVVPWPLFLFSRHSPSYLPATGVSPPPQPLCARRGARTFLHQAMCRCPSRASPPGCSSRLDSSSPGSRRQV